MPAVRPDFNAWRWDPSEGFRQPRLLAVAGLTLQTVSTRPRGSAEPSSDIALTNTADEYGITITAACLTSDSWKVVLEWGNPGPSLVIVISRKRRAHGFAPEPTRGPVPAEAIAGIRSNNSLHGLQCQRECLQEYIERGLSESRITGALSYAVEPKPWDAATAS
jgi:hypothetical protein